MNFRCLLIPEVYPGASCHLL